MRKSRGVFVMKVLLIDDEIEILTTYENKLKHYYPYMDIVKCKKIEAMVQKTIDEKPDLIISDIFLKTKSTIDVIKNNKEVFSEIPLILVSGKDSSSFDVYDVDHIYFLTKPVDDEKLKKAINKFFDIHNKEFLSVLIQRNIVNILIKDIRYIESSIRKAIIYLDDNVYSTYEKLDNIQEKLGSSFVRINQSFLVSKKFIKIIKHKQVILFNDYVINISRKNQQKVLEEIK